MIENKNEKDGRDDRMAPEGAVPALEVPEQQIEIGEKDVKEAARVLWSTLDMPVDEKLENFPEKLTEAIKALPRYQELSREMEKVPDKDLFFEIFKAMRRSADLVASGAGKPADGVLIRSMKEGTLQCAGRVMIASAYMRERGMDHSVAKPPGHVMLVAEVDGDTLAYSDPNNDLYFTFPKTALRGYKGQGELAEGQIDEYVPRPKDKVEGAGSVFGRFLLQDPEQGNLRSYLGNVKAALANLEEFSTSGIPKDMRAGDAVDVLKEKLLGQADPVIESFQSRSEQMKKQMQVELDADKRLCRELLENRQQEEFVAQFSAALAGDLGKRQYPYLKNAPEPARREYAEKLWRKYRGDPKSGEKIIEKQ